MVGHVQEGDGWLSVKIAIEKDTWIDLRLINSKDSSLLRDYNGNINIIINEQLLPARHCFKGFTCVSVYSYDLVTLIISIILLRKQAQITTSKQWT